MRMCAVSVVRLVNVFSQIGSSHLYGRLPVCVLRCRASELESPNVLLHPGYSQPWGFSPVCTRICTSNAERYCAYIRSTCDTIRNVSTTYLNEFLPATCLSAYEWTLACVYSYVTKKIATPREPLSALFTRMWVLLAI